MQQNNQLNLQQQSLDTHYQCFQTFCNFLTQRQQFIEKDLSPFIISKQEGLAHFNYPFHSLKVKNSKLSKQIKPNQNTIWSNILKKIASRIQTYKKSNANHKLILSSDILIWSIPSICSCYMGIMNYIRKWKSQQKVGFTGQNQIERTQRCKNKIEKFQENKVFANYVNKQEVSELSILRISLLIISEFLEKWAEIVKYYERMELLLKERLIKISESQDKQLQESEEAKILKTQLNRAKIQKYQIQGRVKQAQKFINDIQKGQNLDPEVYKNRLIMNQYINVNPKNKYLFMFGKRLLFFNMLKKRSAKAEKHLKERRDAVYQLIDKQKFYIDILAQYLFYIKHPIQALNILTKEQKQLLFSDIQQIKSFHQIMYQNLYKTFQNDHKYQTYGNIVKQYIPFFKLYIQYIYVAQKAQNFLIKLNNQNPKIKQICDKYFIQKHKTASNELMQPTFKIARYQMLFDQILKKTNTSFADYKLFSESKQIFKENLTKVNDTVDKIVRRNRLNQLQQQFGTVDQPIFIKQKCQFLNQFNLFMVYQEKRINVVLFAFTDLILIVQQNTRKKLKYIVVDQKFYARREQDSKIYRNVIKIHSNQGYITLTAGTQQKYLKKADQLFQVLKKIQKTTEFSQLTYVQVLGTQEIGSTSFAKHTQYIIEVKYMSLKKLLHLRFSQIANIVKIMQNFYKDSLGITEQQTLKKTWFNNHKSKTIEDRKRTIEQILQRLFNSQTIKLQPKFLLNYLNLPQNFFQIGKRLSTKKTQDAIFTNLIEKFQKVDDSSISKEASLQLSGTYMIPDISSSTLSKKQNHLSKRQLKDAFTILCATQIKLGRDIYHDCDQKIQSKKQKAQKIQIYINTMKQDQVIMVRVTQFDTVQDVCDKVSKLIGLRSNRDFRLFHEIGKKQLRVLEHQQLILKLFTFPSPKKQSLINVGSIFETVTSSIKKIVSPQMHPTLIFKKYYFLPYEIQSRQNKKDLTRLRLLSYQVFSQIKDLKYQLNFDQYLFFAALLIYIEHQGQVQNKKFDQDIIHKIIPQTIFKLKNYTQDQWLVKIKVHLVKIQQQIKKVIEYNKEQMKFNKIRTDENSKMALYFGHRHLACQIVLNKIKVNPIYGSNLFYIQPYKKTYEQLKQKSLKIAYNMWLAVKVDSLNLLTPSNKESQFELKYSEIEKINVYSEAIVFKTDDYTNKQYRFNTYQSFEISQLVRYYKTLNEMLKELGQNDKLASEVKKYRNQIQQYRSTYEIHDQIDMTINMY